ncbi:MAG: AraC family transcriptional regulator [Bacteroidetes bacterium]|nr:AraC family transcriptional regulator [Bacteroidota bacterium]
MKYPLKKISIIVIIASVLVGIALFFFRTTELSLFPGNPEFKVQTYNDSLGGGNTKVDFTIDTLKYARFKYELGDKIEYPYAGLDVQPKMDTAYFDISEYEFVVVKLKAKESKIIPVNIRVYCEGFSKPGIPNTYMSFIRNIEDSVIDNTYEIPLNEFMVPEWWYKDNGLENGNKLHPSFAKVQSINIEQGAIMKPHMKDEITVYDISLKKSNFWYLYVLIVGLFVGLSVLIYDYSNRKKTIFVPYQSMPGVSNSTEFSDNIVLDYIASNYSNPELGLGIISQATGTPDTRISAIIKGKYNQSFKQYLNNIRMTEAKRLLKESTLSISEIAYSVGYSNVSHFNRVFKTESGISPGDFRKSV